MLWDREGACLPKVMCSGSCVGLTPTPGSCWVPEAAGKWDWRVADVTGVCLLVALGLAHCTHHGVKGQQTTTVSPAWQPRPSDRRSLGRGRNQGGTVGLARR